MVAQRPVEEEAPFLAPMACHSGHQAARAAGMGWASRAGPVPKLAAVVAGAFPEGRVCLELLVDRCCCQNANLDLHANAQSPMLALSTAH